jgi:hypothetical protein
VFWKLLPSPRRIAEQVVAGVLLLGITPVGTWVLNLITTRQQAALKAAAKHGHPLGSFDALLVSLSSLLVLVLALVVSLLIAGLVAWVIISLMARRHRVRHGQQPPPPKLDAPQGSIGIQLGPNASGTKAQFFNTKIAGFDTAMNIEGPGNEITMVNADLRAGERKGKGDAPESK